MEARLNVEVLIEYTKINHNTKPPFIWDAVWLMQLVLPSRNGNYHKRRQLLTVINALCFGNGWHAYA